MSTLLFSSTMEKVNFNYSMKNIPIPSNSEYTKRLIEKTEQVIKRMRWKAFFHLYPDTANKSKHIETYGFNSRKTPPQIDEMKKFEEDMLTMTENIQFGNTRCQFLSKLNKDVQHIKQSESLFIPADKTNNYYKLPKEEYHKLLKDNVTSKYKRSTCPQINNINIEAKEIAEKLHLTDRMDTIAQKEAFITLKDHKDNFPNHIQCRLINPAKSEIGIVSKHILDRINRDVIKATNTRQWKNTNAVIEWFNSIPDKENCTFLQFDIVEFYPSITQALFEEAITWASQFTSITDSDKDIIRHAKKTLLFHDDSPWEKSTAPHLFDVTMGSYDGAETCELVGTFILSKIKHLFNEEVGLYRDDGLAILRKTTLSQANRIAKELISTLKKIGLRITTDIGIKNTNFLDVTLSLKDSTYRPYQKPNTTTRYVNRLSNHPDSITKAIPRSINLRLSNISSDQDQFNTAARSYQEALENAGYLHKMEYQKTDSNNRRKNRSRNIIWYNPPYSKHVTTNIGKKFLQLIDRHFPKSNQLHKIFNRNNTKISYSCMDNMGKIINAHNKAILQLKTETPNRQCNCRIKDECPIPGNCLTKNVIYKATVETNSETKEYIGACETDFKTRHRNHKSSFKLEHKKNDTELSKHLWGLKNKNTEYNLKWTILKHANSYNNTTKRCNLCLWEKFFIINADKRKILNRRTELISKCRHSNKFLLQNT